MTTYEEYLERFAYLITKLDDENAAWLVMSIEADSVVTLSFISDLMYDKFDKTADHLYTMYTLSGVSYESVEKAVKFLKDEYTVRNLPTGVSSDTMLHKSQVVDYLNNQSKGYDL